MFANKCIRKVSVKSWSDPVFVWNNFVQLIFFRVICTFITLIYGIIYLFTLKILSLNSNWLFTRFPIHHKNHCEVNLFCTCKLPWQVVTVLVTGTHVISNTVLLTESLIATESDFQTELSYNEDLIRGPVIKFIGLEFFPVTFFHFSKKKLDWSEMSLNTSGSFQNLDLFVNLRSPSHLVIWMHSV